MKTITHIFKTFFPDSQGGLEEAIRQISKLSIRNGYRVKVVSVSKKPSNKIINGIECCSYKFSVGNDSIPVSFDMIRNFNKIIEDTDIIQLHYPYPVGEILTLINSSSKPIILTFHCEILGRKFLRLCYEPLLKKLLNKVDVIVPTSFNLLDSTPILKKYCNKSEVINLWLDESRFDIPEPMHSISIPNKYALFVGVLRWYKGLDILLDSAKRLKGDIIIIGKGPFYARLAQRIDKEKIKNVYLLGYQPDDIVFYYMKHCSFFILPSISPAEAFGQVLLEASCCHKPMITTELGTGTSYVNLDNITGYVISPNDSNAIIEKSNSLFTDDKLRISMGEAAYQRFLNNFTEQVQGQNYINLYEKLLSKLK